jgi:hypothetical protein
MSQEAQIITPTGAKAPPTGVKSMNTLFTKAQLAKRAYDYLNAECNVSDLPSNHVWRIAYIFADDVLRDAEPEFTFKNIFCESGYSEYLNYALEKYENEQQAAYYAQDCY